MLLKLIPPKKNNLSSKILALNSCFPVSTLRLLTSNRSKHEATTVIHMENGGTLGMVSLTINPIYTLYSIGYPLLKGYLGGVKQLFSLCEH